VNAPKRLSLTFGPLTYKKERVVAAIDFKEPNKLYMINAEKPHNWKFILVSGPYDSENILFGVNSSSSIFIGTPKKMWILDLTSK